MIFLRLISAHHPGTLIWQHFRPPECVATLSPFLTYAITMDAEEDDLGSADALGLHRVLASAGIDTNAFSNFFSKTGGKATTSFADVDADDNEDKFEDDVSDLGLPEESEEVKKAREEEKAAEARWYRRALAMQAEVGQGEEERKKRRKEKELNEVDELKRVWPGFEKGQRLSMVEVFYDTPMMRRDWAIALGKKKRRKLETQTCELPGGCSDPRPRSDDV